MKNLEAQKQVQEVGGSGGKFASPQKVSKQDQPAGEEGDVEDSGEENAATSQKDTKAGQRQRSMTRQKESDILAQMACLVDGFTQKDLHDTGNILYKIRTGEFCDPFDVSQFLL